MTVLRSIQDVLNEVERNLHDAMGVARNVAMDPRLVPGGGAVEMAVSRALNDKSSTVCAVLRTPVCMLLVAVDGIAVGCLLCSLVMAT